MVEITVKRGKRERGNRGENRVCLVGEAKEMGKTVNLRERRRRNGGENRVDGVKREMKCEGTVDVRERGRGNWENRAKGERGKRNGRENRICEMTKGEEITKNA